MKRSGRCIEEHQATHTLVHTRLWERGLAAPQQRVVVQVHEHGGHARRVLAPLQRVVVRAVLLPALVAQDLRGMLQFLSKPA